MKRIVSLWLLFLAFLVAKVGSQNQRTILGDIREQYISQVYDEDVREEKVYRRPPTYLIIASKIVRPSTIYQVSLNDGPSSAFYLHYIWISGCSVPPRRSKTNANSGCAF